MKVPWIRILFFILIFAVIGVYIADLTINHTPYHQGLPRTVAIVFLLLAGLLRTWNTVKRLPLSFFEQQYWDIVEKAFNNNCFWHKKLLSSIRLYHEERYTKALKYLKDLKRRASSPEDHFAVNLFAALSFTEIGIYDTAEMLYRQLIQMDLANTRIYSNLGHVLVKKGDIHKALHCYETALFHDEKNPYAHNNIAQAYFRMHQLDKAIDYAKKALEIAPTLQQPAALLAIIYSLQEDREAFEKYYHIAISNGRDANDLNEAIDYYKNEKHAFFNTSSV